ncbi:MAG: ketopantoate reductase family protein [Candidatus Thiodiazotropha sp. (ex. Lucinisca nassula)]|nr:ketopantoate reductase family protein [Candidatus Thiodiazotropha sp. (ex. Lucinisca nassula)]MBW9276043.1 ketopantoate reductase family protein [Candidatus Thiodiazotropha sp. (ex. Lucinisca nassula)]
MRSIKRTCVLGAGSIGSLFAGHLGTVAESTVLTRRESHANDLVKKGLRVSGKSDLHSRIIASTDPADLGEVDLIIIATKANAVEESARRIEGHFPDAMVMTVQNGLGCEALVAQYGNWPIISAVTFMSGFRHSDTHVEYELDTATWLGPWAEGKARYQQVKEVEALINRSGLKAEAFPDLQPAQWSKLIFNAVVNSVAALSDLPHVKAFAACSEIKDLGNLVHAAMDEGKRVAVARGVNLYEDPWEMNIEATSHGQTGNDDYAHVPSMLEDVRAKRMTEVDWITGSIVREAAKAGVPAPINETLYRLVKALESSWKSV